MLSATRRRIPCLATRRSTTTSIVCLKFLGSRIDSESSRTSPSIAREEALPRELLEELLVLALATADHRREDLEAGAFGKLEHLIAIWSGVCLPIGRPQL